MEGAVALRDKLATWEGGHIVVHIAEMPIKCPVAPLEFAFLADDFFRRKKMRDDVKISYVTPMSGAFTKPTAAKVLGHVLGERGCRRRSCVKGWLVADFQSEVLTENISNFIAGKPYACKASVDMFGLAVEDFIPQVEKVRTVGESYEMSEGAEMIFT